MRIIRIAFLLWSVIAQTNVAMAYETGVRVNTCAKKAASDNVLVDSGVLNVPSDWSPGLPPLLYSASDSVSGQSFSIGLVDNSIFLMETLPHHEGLASEMTYSSMDPLHDGVHYEGPVGYSIRYKLYIGTDLTWIEITNGKLLSSPTKNTVFFVGMPAALWAKEAEGHCSQYKFANDEKLKNDIQRNYSLLYYPGRTPLLIDFGKSAKGAMVSLEMADLIQN